MCPNIELGHDSDWLAGPLPYWLTTALTTSSDWPLQHIRGSTYSAIKAEAWRDFNFFHYEKKKKKWDIRGF